MKYKLVSLYQAQSKFSIHQAKLRLFYLIYRITQTLLQNAKTI